MPICNILSNAVEYDTSHSASQMSGMINESITITAAQNAARIIYIQRAGERLAHPYYFSGLDGSGNRIYRDDRQRRC